MSDPDHPTDFSARSGCVWAPMLAIVLVALIAAAVLIGQHRFPFQTTPDTASKLPSATGPPATTTR